MAQTPEDKQHEPPPARRGRAAVLADDAQAAGMKALERAGFADARLVLRWDEIAGPETAGLARPIRLSQGPSGGVLTLRAEPGAAVFLQHDSRALCERINTYLGRPAVARLKFVPGPVTSRRKQLSSAVSKPPLSGSDPAQRYAGPEGLREAILKLARARGSAD